MKNNHLSDSNSIAHFKATEIRNEPINIKKIPKMYKSILREMNAILGILRFFGYLVRQKSAAVFAPKKDIASNPIIKVLLNMMQIRPIINSPPPNTISTTTLHLIKLTNYINFANKKGVVI